MPPPHEDSKVQLGCGSLILIALIVAMFSGGRDSREMTRELERVRGRMDQLEKKMDLLLERQQQGLAPPTSSKASADETSPPLQP